MPSLCSSHGPVRIWAQSLLRPTKLAVGSGFSPRRASLWLPVERRPHAPLLSASLAAAETPPRHVSPDLKLRHAEGRDRLAPGRPQVQEPAALCQGICARVPSPPGPQVASEGCTLQLLLVGIKFSRLPVALLVSHMALVAGVLGTSGGQFGVLERALDFLLHLSVQGIMLDMGFERGQEDVACPERAYSDGWHTET